jgi:outer membrane protein OmpA-like peptidoglycan-associated protein
MEHAVMKCLSTGVRVGLALGLALMTSVDGWATPTQYGESGLLSQPSAETLNAGNISLGLWSNIASRPQAEATLVPVTITLGLGSFLEAYGSYPNLLFNDEEPESGRGFANIGMKARVWGKRSDPFKLAVDGQFRRMVAEDPSRDGLTDTVARLIASYKPGRFGLHAHSGYAWTESPADASFDDQTLLGAGVEYFPALRLRLIAEFETASSRQSGLDDTAEAMAGLQYYLSPHLTLNAGLGFGLTDASPDWRALLGLSATQGVGTYAKTIPKIIQPAPEEAEKPAQSAKVIRVRTLTSLIPKTTPIPESPVSKLEVPVTQGREEVVIEPSEQLVLSEPGPVKSQPIAPMAAPTLPDVPPPGLVESPFNTIVYRKFRLPEFAFDFDQWSLSAEGKKVLLQIAESLRQEGKWLFIRIDGHTDNIGPDSYNEKLSLKRAVAAASHLVAHAGMDPQRIFVKGFGEREPLASNESAEGRALNRRLELLVLVPKEEAK